MKKTARIVPVLMVSFAALVPTAAHAQLCTGTLDERIACLNDKLQYVSISTDAGGQPLVTVKGANVLIIRSAAGYGGNLIVGSGHTWTKATDSFVAGISNTVASQGASVCGGKSNRATGPWSSVSGGYDNEASGYYASIAGGRSNRAITYGASVGGGHSNTASAIYSSVSGGHSRSVDGPYNWRAGDLFEGE